jgi:DNA invertase Pin-like site-specific DNA recombinase
MIYGYARISTKKQIKGNSLEEQVAQLQHHKCDYIIEEQYSGNTTVRPLFNELINKVVAGDKIVVTKLDRFARNVTEGIQVIKELFTKDVQVHVLNIGLLENTPMGKFFLITLLAVAELERNMIIERTQAGKEVARTKNGFKDGRPKKYNEHQLQHAMNLLNEYSYTQVEEMTGISKSTLIREKRQNK